jgi:hypothetical protein
MSKASKDPIALAQAALAAGAAAFPPYSHRNSPHKYTQAQLFALLVLRQFFRLDYRGVIVWLRRWSDLRQVLGLKQIPHYSTLCYAEDRLLKKGARIDSWMPPLPWLAKPD